MQTDLIRASLVAGMGAMPVLASRVPEAREICHNRTGVRYSMNNPGKSSLTAKDTKECQTFKIRGISPRG